MSALHFRRPIAQVLPLAVSLIANAASQPTQLLRWIEGQPGCAFQASDDGTYRYALATEDFSITLAMDAQELEKSRRRIEPVLGLFLSVRFLKHDPPRLATDEITLQFVKHFQEKQAPLDPGRLIARLQAHAEKEEQTAAREIRKHPEKIDEIQAALKAQQQNTSQMIEWVHTKTLQSISPENKEVSGWLLFAARTRWIGQLNRQEEFLLRVPLGDVVVEFPFTLPPSQDDIRLRTRASVGRTLLSANCSVSNGSSRKVKASGQECPLHTFFFSCSAT
jgi:hypothetical protein